MKLITLLLVSSLALSPLYSFSNNHKIDIKGKVAAINNPKAVKASIGIRAKGIDFTFDTDSEGNFAATIFEVPEFTISIQASGFEKLEQTIKVPDLKSDSLIQIPVALTPVEKLRLSGMIFDKKTSKPIKAEFDLFFDTDIVREDVEIVADGKYSEGLTDFGWYIIDISAKGYLGLSDTIWVMDCSRTNLLRDYYLTPIEAGLTVRLKNIQFNFGKTSLDPSSFAELNDVVDLLKMNPDLKLEIAGHTDSDGPDDYNLWLSQSRAQAVVDYLTSQGSSAAQLVAKGYGESKPTNNEDTAAAKSQNRRVEFVVLQN